MARPPEYDDPNMPTDWTPILFWLFWFLVVCLIGWLSSGSDVSYENLDRPEYPGSPV